MENLGHFIELLQSQYFYGPIVGMAGLFLSFNWLQRNAERRAAK